MANITIMAIASLVITTYLIKFENLNKKFKKKFGKIYTKPIKFIFYFLCVYILVFYINEILVSPINIVWYNTENYDAYMRDLIKNFKSWQTLNAAVLTLIGAIFFYQGATRREKGKQLREEKKEAKRLQRELIASRAFIPHALASIIPYLVSASKYYEEVYRLIMEDEIHQVKTIEHNELDRYRPMPLNSYQSAFKDFFRYAPPIYTNWLVKIVEDLQVVESRMQPDSLSLRPENVVGELVLLCEILAKVQRSFSYARGDTDEFDNSPLTKNEYIKQLNTLGQDEMDAYRQIMESIDRRFPDG